MLASTTVTDAWITDCDASMRRADPSQLRKRRRHHALGSLLPNCPRAPHHGLVFDSKSEGRWAQNTPKKPKHREDKPTRKGSDLVPGHEESPKVWRTRIPSLLRIGSVKGGLHNQSTADRGVGIRSSIWAASNQSTTLVSIPTLRRYSRHTLCVPSLRLRHSIALVYTLHSRFIRHHHPPKVLPYCRFLEHHSPFLTTGRHAFPLDF